MVRSKRTPTWLKEIQHYQRSQKLLLRKLPFARLIREISRRISPNELRWQSLALQALQEATEAFMVDFFEDTALLAHHANRVTIRAKDFQTLLHLKYRSMGINPKGG